MDWQLVGTDLVQAVPLALLGAATLIPWVAGVAALAASTWWLAGRGGSAGGRRRRVALPMQDGSRAHLREG